MSEFKTPLRRLGTYSTAALASSLLLPAALGKPAPQTEASAAVETNPQLIFDDLRPGHHDVQIYESPYTTKKEHGIYVYFRDGDKIDVRCKTLGRLVVSNPRKGERRRHSRQFFWVEAIGKKKWASATYVRNLRQLRADPRLKDC